MIDQQTQNAISNLEARIKALENINRVQGLKGSILVDGDFDGTNIPVLINGIRRKIETLAP